MKRRILSLAIGALLGAGSLFAQIPQAMKYQGIARNNGGTALANQALTVRLTIHDLTPNGTTVYQETHTVTTSPFGLYNINMGMGTVLSGTFSAFARS